MLDFLNIFTNPWFLLMIVAPIMLVFGLIGGNILSQPRKNRVLKVDPQSHRGVELEINSEDTINVYCNPVGKMPPQKFIKYLEPFNVIRKGWLKIQNYALWFGRFGTAYVHKFNNEPVKLSFKKAVYTVFGKRYYKQIPANIKQRIESGSIGVTIEFPKGPLTPKSKGKKALPSVSESDIRRDDDQRAMSNLWDTFDKEKKKSVINILMAIGTGVAIGIAICLLMKWGGPIIIQSPPPGG